MNELQNKVAVVTGGAGGIGLATVKKFHEAGAKVLLVDLKQEAVDAAVKQLNLTNVKGFAADVSKAADAKAYVKAAVDAFGGLDVVFANAGIEGAVKPIVEYPEEVFDRVLAVNLKGVYLAMREAIPELLKRGGGSIVATASVAGIVGSPGLSAYVASKHAVTGLVKTVANEFGAKGIRVNAIAPGPVDNRMMRSLENQLAPGQGEVVKAGFIGQVPLGRYATNEDVADLALFLAGPRSAYCSGSVFPVDGGFTSH
ncbi:MAG: SDR family oxidoreductase [Myxococcus sp.]|nr:SDR family oxidoreductase [Myxococcus sp.]